MHAQFTEDLVWLTQFVFSKTAKIAELVRRYQESKKQIDEHCDAALIWKVYAWLLTPYSLWPIDFDFVAEVALNSAHGQKSLPRKIKLVLELLALAPSRASVRPILEFEKPVKEGAYEVLLKQSQKYDDISQELINDPFLMGAWTQLKAIFPVEKYKNKAGVIRRTLCCERNMRLSNHGKPNSKEARFYDAFDAFCHHWQLYGMQHDIPLPLKVTVNPTPHGILIMIPRLWSLDVKRDIDWKLVQRLHHCYGARRQGPRLSPARAAIQEEIRAVAVNFKVAKKKGIRGEKRYEFLREQMNKDPRTDSSWFKRRLKKAKQCGLLT